MNGILTLVPTPLSENGKLEQSAFEILAKACANLEKNTFLIETPKAGRRRWVHFGLPRDVVNELFPYNEHNQEELIEELLEELKSGKNIYLMSDGGLPAFCDPGQKLVAACHHAGVKVTITPFANSVILAVALSGFWAKRFVFEGFLPVKTEQRQKELDRILVERNMSIIMDTPYRMNALLTDISLSSISRDLCLALDLNLKTEEIHFGTANQLVTKLGKQKREFILLTKPMGV